MRYVAVTNHESRGRVAPEGQVIYYGNVLNTGRDITSLCRHEPVVMAIFHQFVTAMWSHRRHFAKEDGQAR